ncbi:hypothetical protein [Streptomyces sp. enrichment culture]|uniref:arsenate reductase/protein-tyrosine-phosphatase family protein n=1 Tax=Streptomyces sp. enrichment culture TaxID=1795815 RepID=UPI003F5449D4
MAWLALGYFASYIPYVMLLKILVHHMSDAAGGPVDGMAVLPAAALGQLAVMPLFLLVSGWWRYALRPPETGPRPPAPGPRPLAPGGRTPPPGSRPVSPGPRSAVSAYRREILAGLSASLIIGTTTLSFTFSGTSVLFVLLLMRGGVLVMSPLMDKARGRHVPRSAWAALAFSLAAVLVAVGGVRDYRLALPALLCLCVYLAGYTARFDLMSRAAKAGVAGTDRRYFTIEHATAPVCLVLLLGAGALAGQPGLRAGFTDFLATPTAWAAAGVGVAYEVLFVFGTLIYLDRRAFTWCVPANRCASLMSGLVAAYALHHLAGLPLPTDAELLALVMVVAAVVSLSAPALAQRRGPAAHRRRVVFVCGGNTSRSPLAEYIARHEARGGGGGAPRFTSAGLDVEATARRHRARMSPHARAALRDLGVRPGWRHPRFHRARPLTPKLCRGGAVVYCMTGAQREAVLALAPEATARVHCLDPRGDIPNPAGQPADVHLECARRIRRAVRARFPHPPGGGAPHPPGGDPNPGTARTG